MIFCLVFYNQVDMRLDWFNWESINGETKVKRITIHFEYKNWNGQIVHSEASYFATTKKQALSNFRDIYGAVSPTIIMVVTTEYVNNPTILTKQGA